MIILARSQEQFYAFYLKITFFSAYTRLKLMCHTYKKASHNLKGNTSFGVKLCYWNASGLFVTPNPTVNIIKHYYTKYEIKGKNV